MPCTFYEGLRRKELLKVQLKIVKFNELHYDTIPFNAISI